MAFAFQTVNKSGEIVFCRAWKVFELGDSKII